MSVLKGTIAELQELYKQKQISVKEVAEQTLQQIKAVEPSIQAFLTVTEEQALQQATLKDGQDAAGSLFGIPVAIKDNIVTKDIKTTAASKMLENFVPVYSATAVEKLEQAGAISFGKLNLDEFAMGSTTENSAFQATTNPWDITKVPGGSSGGSAAAVAANEVLLTLGTDTGGSIRQPAAFCGVVGMKPTYGRVSRHGLIAFASSLDQIGPITKTVKDNAIALEAIAGEDLYDSSSAEQSVPHFVESLEGNLRGLKVAVPKEYFGEGVDQGVKEQVHAAIRQLEALGATVDEVSLPHSKYASETYYVIASAEASSNLARYDGIHYGYRTKHYTNLDEIYFNTRGEAFGDEVKKRLLFGTYALSGQHHEDIYVHAQKVRHLIAQDFKQVFEQYDVIVGPSAATPAYDLGKAVQHPLTVYANDVLTTPVNLAGVPAMSVPCGFVDGLPVGLQLIGKHFDEATLYRVAYAFEQATDFHKQQPSLAGGVKE